MNQIDKVMDLTTKQLLKCQEDLGQITVLLEKERTVEAKEEQNSELEGMKTERRNKE